MNGQVDPHILLQQSRRILLSIYLTDTRDFCMWALAIPTRRYGSLREGYHHLTFHVVDVKETVCAMIHPFSR